MDDVNVTEALLQELLEHREVITPKLQNASTHHGSSNIKRVAAPSKQPATQTPRKVSRKPYPGHLDYNRVRQKYQGGTQNDDV
ncbi:MAG: hypothetical protein V8S92_04085 [Oscillospiraceae bacterium]